MPDPNVQDPPAPVLAKTLIPQDLHTREYVKPWLEKPWTPELASEVFKKLDNAETLVGKKTVPGVPGPDAKPEEVEAFYNSLRAAKPEDYEMTLGEKPDEAFVKTLRTAAHKAGLSKAQMAKFTAELAPDLKAREQAMATANAENVKAFEGFVAKMYGKDNEAVLARVREACKDVPAEIKGYADKLDPKSFAVVAALVNSILVKYALEDDLHGRSEGAGGGSGNDQATLREEARKLMALPAYKDFQNPDHDKTVARVKEIYASPAFKT